MPKTTKSGFKTGNHLLEAVKKAESDAVTARTAVAVERYRTSSSTNNDQSGSELEAQDCNNLSSEEDQDQGSSSVDSQALWARLDFESSGLLVFTRGEWEVITIRKSPTGEGWIINYSEPAESGPL
jgi:hypothetical protein